MGGSLTIVLSFLSVSIPVAVVLAALALWMFAISDESIAAVLVYLALCETYIFLFTLAANGVSVSLMMPVPEVMWEDAGEPPEIPPYDR